MEHVTQAAGRAWQAAWTGLNLRVQVDEIGPYRVRDIIPYPFPGGVRGYMPSGWNGKRNFVGRYPVLSLNQKAGFGSAQTEKLSAGVYRIVAEEPENNSTYGRMSEQPRHRPQHA